MSIAKREDCYFNTPNKPMPESEKLRFISDIETFTLTIRGDIFDVLSIVFATMKHCGYLKHLSENLSSTEEEREDSKREYENLNVLLDQLWGVK